MNPDTNTTAINGNNSRTYKLEHAPIASLVRSYAIPAVVGMMVNSLYNIVDRIFIGQGVNSLALSGLAVTFPILLFLQAFGVLIGVGASARISIMLGRKERDKAENLLGNAFILSLTLSSCSIILCMIFMRSLLLSFGASPLTLPYASDYLMIALPGNIFANLCFTYNAVMRASGYPTKAMTTMLMGAILNMILDPLFIFVFGMGIEGAAIATVISMFVGMCYVMAHFINPNSLIKIRPRYFKIRKEYVIGIISIGMAPFSIQMASSVISVIFNKSLSHYGIVNGPNGGDYAVGAYSILNSLAMLIVMLILGVSQGMQPIVGYNYGAGNIPRVRQTFNICMVTNTIIAIVGFLIALFAPRFVSRLFTSDPEMIDTTVVALRLVLLCFWCVGFQITATQYFQSIGKAKIAMLLSLCRQVIFLMPLLLLLPTIIGFKGVWIAQPISDFMAFILTLVIYRNHVKRQEQLFGLGITEVK